MPDHRIRLARAWTLHAPPLPPRRVDLPTRWDAAEALAPFELIRSFNSPPIDPTCQSIDLELADLPGLQTLRLNGEELRPRWDAAAGAARVPLDSILQHRNTLRLIGDLTGVNREPLWGTIALVISDRSQ